MKVYVVLTCKSKLIIRVTMASNIAPSDRLPCPPSPCSSTNEYINQINAKNGSDNTQESTSADASISKKVHFLHQDLLTKEFCYIISNYVVVWTPNLLTTMKTPTLPHPQPRLPLNPHHIMIMPILHGQTTADRHIKAAATTKHPMRRKRWRMLFSTFHPG